MRRRLSLLLAAGALYSAGLAPAAHSGRPDSAGPSASPGPRLPWYPTPSSPLEVRSEALVRDASPLGAWARDCAAVARPGPSELHPRCAMDALVRGLSRASLVPQRGTSLKATWCRPFRRRHSLPARSINAAMAFGPWRTVEANEPFNQVQLLQCGHGPRAVEDLAESDGERVAGRASMRPRPEGRGEPRLRHPLRRRRLASMRPRPEGRGEPTEGAWSTASGTWGFNAATARRPWRTIHRAFKTRMCPHALQCGRGPKAVENVVPRRGHHHPVEASMRPRPEGRGEHRGQDQQRPGERRFNAATARRPWRTRRVGAGVAGLEDASMRPRPEGRGERRKPGYDFFRSPRLQCGHGPKAVENSYPGFRPGPKAGRFNAATARRPWRTVEARVRPPRVEIASMRPRPEGRGEPSCSPPRLCPGMCSFNAATARRPWRTTLTSVLVSPNFLLQCGHGPKAVEN